MKRLPIGYIGLEMGDTGQEPQDRLGDTLLSLGEGSSHRLSSFPSGQMGTWGSPGGSGYSVKMKALPAYR